MKTSTLVLGGAAVVAVVLLLRRREATAPIRGCATNSSSTASQTRVGMFLAARQGDAPCLGTVSGKAPAPSPATQLPTPSLPAQPISGSVSLSGATSTRTLLSSPTLRTL